MIRRMARDPEMARGHHRPAQQGQFHMVARSFHAQAQAKEKEAKATGVRMVAVIRMGTGWNGSGPSRPAAGGGPSFKREGAASAP